MQKTIVCPTPIAILMAAYNAEKYIAEQIESVLLQTSNNWTLYIRNDGSSDSTQDIIEHYIDKYPDKIFQIDKNGDNLGCNCNFFRLLESINASYYMFCDADDVWNGDKTRILFEEIQSKEKRYPNIPILVQSDMTVCDEKLNIIHNSLWDSLNLEPWRFNSFNLLMTTPVVGGATSIFNDCSKQYIFPIPHNKRIMYDHWVGLCIVKHGKLFCVKESLTMYRQHVGQVCGLDSLQQKEFILKVLRRKLRNWRRDAELFHSIGVPRWKFYFYKIKSHFIRR